MNKTCPKCGIDTTQSSGVVCPECGFVIQPDADSAPLLQQAKTGRRGLGLILSFLIPSSVTALSVVASGGPPVPALVAGGIIGIFFLLAWLMAGRVSHSPAGQLIAGVLFFFGGIAIVAGVLVGGCMFALR